VRGDAVNGRVRLGNAMVLAILVAGALALARLHASPWWPGDALGWQWRAAWGCLAGYALLCVAVGWRRRAVEADTVAKTTEAAPATQTLVVWASQTGFAHELAGRSVATLQGAGVAAHALPLEQLDAATLQQAARVLLIASTTGEGDPPDHASGFLRRVLPDARTLSGLRYGVLALGDRSYEQFCAFGRELDEWLAHRGAHALFDRVEVDNADPGALRHWQYLLAQLGDGHADADWERPQYQRWKLQARELSNPGCEAPAWRLSLQPSDGDWPQWQAGDIAEIGPCHSPTEVEQWLRDHALEGEAIVQGQTLRQWVARAQWATMAPAAQAAPLDLEAFVATLQPLPHREYSIASTPRERSLELLVRCQRAADGRLGLGSGWLCQYAPLGGEVALRIRANPGFHAPEPALPLILIGNGTGLAGLRSQLRARVEAGARRNWLLFGERHAAHDGHYDTDLQRWRQEGWLSRLDAVYSRDGGALRYVQDALRAAAPTLREWVDAGASIYVCGSLQGMAPAVDAVIEETLGAGRREDLLASGRYRRDVY